MGMLRVLGTNRDGYLRLETADPWMPANGRQKAAPRQQTKRRTQRRQASKLSRKRNRRR